MKRGEVRIAAIANIDGRPPKNHPIVVVQADSFNRSIGNILVAHVTSNLTRQGDGAHVFLDVSTPDGQKTGLRSDSLISCVNLSVVKQSNAQRQIGELSGDLMKELDACLKRALGL